MDEDRPRGITSSLTHAFLPWIVSCGLAAFFWFPLLKGAGLVGGDIYAYFLPLRQFYAEGLKANEWRFWNPKIGHGIPVLGESQTGFFYPPYLLAYRYLDLDRGYTAVFLAHYVLAFIFTTLLARAVGLRLGTSLLAATVFVYGWFPPRSCLEWSIVTGTWLPLALFLTARWLHTGSNRWGLGLAATLALQLLAGHFQIAFLTLLAIGWMGATTRGSEFWSEIPLARRAGLTLFVLLGFLFAAPQLLPTWELKGRSRRASVDEVFLSQGTIPPSYFPQLVAPFWYYTARSGELVDVGGVSNNIEAHLYAGLAPIGLAIMLLFRKRGRRSWRDWWSWLLLALLALFLASGCFHPWILRLPGFGYFQAPGRYGLLAQLGLAMLAGHAGDRFLPRHGRSRWLVLGLLLTVTTADLYWVSRRVTFTKFARPPILDYLPASPVVQALGPTDRILAPVPNILSLSRASCVPPYVGLLPIQYASLWETRDLDKFYFGELPADTARIEHLRSAGVTHLLTRSLLGVDWPARVLWSGSDPFLDRLYGIPDRLYLYRFEPSPGRVHLRENGGISLDAGSARIVRYEPNLVEIECDVLRPVELVLADLQFPGWQVRIDGEHAESSPDPHFRVVPVPVGKHRVLWSYAPRFLWTGIAICAAALLVMVITMAIWARFHRQGER